MNVATWLFCLGGSAVILIWSIVVDYKKSRDALNFKNLALINVLVINVLQPAFGLLLSDFRFVDLRQIDDETLISRALLLTLGGCLALVVGLHLEFGDAIARRVAPVVARARLNTFVIKISAIGLVLLTSASALYAIFFVGADGSTYLDRIKEFRYGLISSQGVSFWRRVAIAMGGIGFLYAQIFVLMVDHTLRVRMRVKSRTWIIIASLCPFLSLLSGFRGPFVVGIIMLGAYAHNFVRRQGILTLIALGCLVGVLVAGLGAGRAFIEAGGDTGARVEVSDEFTTSVIQRTRGLETLVLTLGYFDSNPEAQRRFFGDSVIESLTLLVPRAWVDWKPRPVSFRFGEEIFGIYLMERDGRVSDATNGFSAPLFSFFYWQAGVVGVLAVSLLAGVFLRIYASTFYGARYSTMALGLYLIAGPGLITFAEHPQVGANTIQVAVAVFIIGVTPSILSPKAA